MTKPQPVRSPFESGPYPPKETSATMQEIDSSFADSAASDILCQDQQMATRFCPYCKSNSDMAPVWASSTPAGTSSQNQSLYIVRIAAECANCRNLNTAVSGRRTGSVTSHNGVDAMRNALLQPNLTWSPMAAPAPDFPNVPDHVAQCAKEAHMSHSIGAEAASILMARTTIEATAKSQGVTEGSLYKKIETMKEKSLVRPSMVTVAHAIRTLGNDMAHGDVEELPTSQDAEDALHLMDMILDEVFEAAAVAEAILARREARSSDKG